MTHTLFSRERAALDAAQAARIDDLLNPFLQAVAEAQQNRADLASDPAIRLLAHQFGQLAGLDAKTAAAARRACEAKLAGQAQLPFLKTILAQPVSYDPARKRAFHAEGKRRLKALAHELGLAPLDYEIRSCEGGIAVSGEIILHGDWIYVQLSQHPRDPILYRLCKGRKDCTGEQNFFAGIDALLIPDILAGRIRALKAAVRRNAA